MIPLVPGDQPKRHARSERDGDHTQPGGDRDPAAVDNTRPHVSPEVVGAEPVGAGRQGIQRVDVDGVGVIAGNERGDKSEHDHDPEEEGACHRTGIGAQTAKDLAGE